MVGENKVKFLCCFISSDMIYYRHKSKEKECQNGKDGLSDAHCQ